MKTSMMKTVIVFGLMAVAQTLPAQERMEKLFTETTPEERAEWQTENMQEMLALREDQKAGVHEINLKYAKRMEDAYESGEGKLQRFRSMKAVGQQKDKELKKVLDADQYDAYMKHKEEMKEKVKTAARERRKGK